MKDRRTSWIVAACLVVSAALAVFLFGPDPTQPAARVVEAAGDAVLPAIEMREQRVRRAAIRAELARVLAEQLSSMETDGSFHPDEALAPPSAGFYLETQLAGPRTLELTQYSSPPRWIGLMRHAWSPMDEACAVQVNAERAYVAGIPLLRSARIRCSWDLATQINRLR